MKSRGRKTHINLTRFHENISHSFPRRASEAREAYFPKCLIVKSSQKCSDALIQVNPSKFKVRSSKFDVKTALYFSTQNSKQKSKQSQKFLLYVTRWVQQYLDSLGPSKSLLLWTPMNLFVHVYLHQLLGEKKGQKTCVSKVKIYFNGKDFRPDYLFAENTGQHLDSN